MRIIAIAIFLFSSWLSYAQEYPEEIQTDTLNESVTEQFTSIKPLRVGVRIGVPHLITANVEYLTPLFDNRVAITVDYMGLSKKFSEGIFRFDNFEAGTNVYFNNKGKGLYGSVSYFSFKSGVGFEDYEFQDGKITDGRADFDFNSVNVKLGAKLGSTVYFRVELGYGFGNIPDGINVTGKLNNQELTAWEEIPDVPGISSSGILVFNIGFGIGFL